MESTAGSGSGHIGNLAGMQVTQGQALTPLAGLTSEGDIGGEASGGGSFHDLLLWLITIQVIYRVIRSLSRIFFYFFLVCVFALPFWQGSAGGPAILAGGRFPYSSPTADINVVNLVAAANSCHEGMARAAFSQHRLQDARCPIRQGDVSDPTLKQEGSKFDLRHVHLHLITLLRLNDTHHLHR